MPVTQLPRWIAVLGVSSSLLGCSLNPYGKFVELNFEFLGRGKPNASQIIATSPFFNSKQTEPGDLLGVRNIIAPSDLLNFDCLGVNIVASDIEPTVSYSHDWSSTLSQMYSGSSCAYPGIMSGSIDATENNAFTMSVPTGTNRLIQVIGIMDPESTLCPASENLGDALEENGYAKLFELGRVQLDTYTSQTVSIANTFSSLGYTGRQSKDVTCSGDGTDFALGYAGVYAHFRADQLEDTYAEPGTTGVLINTTTDNFDNLATGSTLDLLSAASCTTCYYKETTLPNGASGRYLAIAAGVGNYMQRATSTTPPPQSYAGFAIFAVVKDLAVDSKIVEHLGSGAPDYLHLQTVSSDLMLSVRGTGGGPYTATITAAEISAIGSGPYLIVGEWQGSTQLDLAIYSATGSDSAFIATAALPTIVANQTFTIGGISTGGTNLMELTVFSQTKSATDVDSLTKHYRYKYGIY